MRIYKDLPHKERPSSPRNECQFYTTIKTPKLSQTKVGIIDPSSNTLELWKFSNLTFKGYLVSTTPVFFARSSLFLCCAGVVSSTWAMVLTIFGIISWRRLWKDAYRLVSYSIASQTKSWLVLTCSMVTINNNQRDEPRNTAFERQV